MTNLLIASYEICCWMSWGIKWKEWTRFSSSFSITPYSFSFFQFTRCQARQKSQINISSELGYTTKAATGHVAYKRCDSVGVSHARCTTFERVMCWLIFIHSVYPNSDQLKLTYNLYVFLFSFFHFFPLFSFFLFYFSSFALSFFYFWGLS